VLTPRLNPGPWSRVNPLATCPFGTPPDADGRAQPALPGVSSLGASAGCERWPTCEPPRRERLTPDHRSRNLSSTGHSVDGPGGGLGGSSADGFDGACGVPSRHRPADARLYQLCLADRLLSRGLANGLRRTAVPGLSLRAARQLLRGTRHQHALCLGRTAPYCPSAWVWTLPCECSPAGAPGRTAPAGTANAAGADPRSR
jgi:hypothetical protein